MTPLLLLASVLLLPAPAASPVTFRLVEVNTAACEWNGAATFTCREVMTPLSIEVRFAPADGRQVVIDMDGTQVAVLAEPGSHTFADDAALAVGPHRLNLILMDRDVATWRKGFRFDVVAHRDPGEQAPPVVSFASPRANDKIAGPVVVEVRAHNPHSDHRDVDRVDISIDGRPLESLSRAPWKTTWDPSADKPGAHVLGAQAYGAGGTSSTEITVIVLERRSLLAARIVEVVQGPPFRAALTFPEHAVKATLEARLAVSMTGKGRVIGRLLDGSGSTVAVLLDMASPVSPAIPFTRDLSQYAGHTLTLELLAVDGGKLQLGDLAVVSYEQ